MLDWQMKVFLSSTGKDLARHREAVISVINSFAGFECDAMENWGPRDSGVAEFDDRRLRECQLAIFLIGHRFGSTPPHNNRISYTQLEYALAERLDKPRLIFMADDRFQIKAIEVEPDRERKLQKTFRDRVKRSGKRIIAEFCDPQELAAQVEAAIRNWEEDRQFRVRVGSYLRPPPRENRGALVQKLCDRHRQEEHFFDFICAARERNRGMPLMCIVPGREGECHGSLAERLTDILSRALGNNGNLARVRSRPVIWQYERGVVQRFRRLLDGLFASFEPKPQPVALSEGEMTASRFQELLRGSFCELAVVHHHLTAAYWDLRTARLLARYRRFWITIPEGTASVPVIIFIHVVFPGCHPDAAAESRPRLSARLGHFGRRAAISAQLRLLLGRSGCPFLVLKELEPIRRPDVYEWMVNNEVFATDQERLDALNEAFPPGGDVAKTMAFIEKFCGELIVSLSGPEEEREAHEYAGELIEQ
jgi:hypothetical protein